MKNILIAHGIETKEINGKLFAKDEWTKDGVPGHAWRNTTGWNKKELRDFLNY